MKPHIAYLFALLIVGPLFAQSNPCAEPLKDGIRDYYKSATNIEKHSSTKDYFRSQDFKEDLKKGGWGGGVVFPVNGIPVGVNANSSDEDFKKFRQEIEKLSDNEINETYAMSLQKSAINLPFVKLYFDCLNHSVGFSTNSEMLGGRVHLVIRFQPMSALSPGEMPMVTEEPRLTNAKDAYGVPKKDTRLDLMTLVTASPVNPSEPVSLELRTTKGPVSVSSTVEKKVTKKVTPPPSSKVVCRIYRLSTDKEYNIDITGGDISVCRKMTEEQSRKDSVNYSFQIQCFDEKGHLVGAGGQNDDGKWPAGCMISK
jgi:hypothetical protein